MKDINTIHNILRSSLFLASDTITFSAVLMDNKKLPIADKLLQSAIDLNKYLYDSLIARLEFDYMFKLERSLNSIDNILYWLNQCSKSKDYPTNPELIISASEIRMMICTELYKSESKCVG